MAEKRAWLIGVVLISLLGLVLQTAQIQQVRAQEGPNLLRNGDFEEGGEGQAWPFQDGIPEVQVAPGWRAFFVDNPPSYAVRPSYCGTDPNCVYWGRPEFRGTSVSVDPLRVHSGRLAQKFHSFNRQMEAGLMQRVEGVTPGTRLHFQAWVQTWSCMAEGAWNNCPTIPYSHNPAPMHIRVGIDPTGGTDPWAGTVVWSGEDNAWDTWTLFQVEATAAADAVTVFVYHRSDWTDGIYRLNNDVYIDDASLVVTTPPTNTPLPPPPTNTPGPSPTPRATPTPRPDGAIVHVVQRGDTLFGIALQYGVPMEQIVQLNAGSLGPDNMIIVGQELVIALPSVTPTPLPTPTPQATPTLETGSVCVLAFHDRNGDAFRQPETEELLPNAVFSLGDASGLLGQYTTDGLNEPHCFSGLAPGSYRLAMQPPTGYLAVEPSAMALALSASTRLEVAFGAHQEEAPATATPPGQSRGGRITWSQATYWIARIGGILLLALAVVVAVLFFLSRRRP